MAIYLAQYLCTDHENQHYRLSEDLNPTLFHRLSTVAVGKQIKSSNYREFWQGQSGINQAEDSHHEAATCVF